jgi:uncharacterized protein DUF1214
MPGHSTVPRCWAGRPVRGGLWGNHGYEAAYPATYTDADGDQLDGRNHYILTLGQDPSVDAFWSITMYDLPGFYLVANPISRYSIGDRTPGPEPRPQRVAHHRDPARPARRHQQLAARPRRTVPAAHAPVPAASHHLGRHLPDTAHHQGHELDHALQPAST